MEKKIIRKLGALGLAFGAKIIIIFLICAAANAEQISYRILEDNKSVGTGKNEKIFLVYKGIASILLYENSNLKINDNKIKISGKAELSVTERFIINEVSILKGNYLCDTTAEKEFVTVIEESKLFLKNLFLPFEPEYINTDIASILNLKKGSEENPPDIPVLMDMLSLDIGCGCVESPGSGVTPIQIPETNPEIEYKK